MSLDATELQHLFCGLIGWDRPSHAKLCLQGTGTFGRRGLDGRVTNSAFDLSFLYCDVDANKNTKFSFGGMFPVTTNELGSGYARRCCAAAISLLLVSNRPAVCSCATVHSGLWRGSLGMR